MKFNEASLEMLKGNKIKRPAFEGYWYINGQTGQVTIHLKADKEITKGNLTLTIKNCIAEDWVVCND
jgi:hypothetical protein